MGTRSIQARAPMLAHPIRPSVEWKPKAETAAQQLDTLRLEFAELRRELFEAAQMQRMLGGPRQLRRGEFEVAAEIFPVRHLSGDFVSISDRGSKTILAIGDVEGKGLRAGLWFTHLLGLTRMHAESAKHPGAALSALNRDICMAQVRPPLTSVFLAELDWAAGTLTYSNAGHPGPLLLRSDGSVQSLDVGGPVLCAVPCAEFESVTIEVRPGEMLIGYSDGLLECENETREEFGTQRVIEEARRVAQEKSVTEILFSMIGAAQDFVGTRTRADDCTVMVLRRNSGESAEKQ
ncbi:MAG TPA: SpoIIE family protein phosphatase [Terriglobales bacterium]